MRKLTERQERRMRRNAEIYAYYVELKKANTLASKHILMSKTEEAFKDKYDVCISTIYHIVEDFEKQIA